MLHDVLKPDRAAPQDDGGDGVAAEDRNGFGDEGEGEEAEEDEGGWEMEVWCSVAVAV